MFFESKLLEPGDWSLSHTTAGGATAGGDGKVIITWYGTSHP